MNLHDKVAIITGGASGLGRAVADALAAGGARVSLFDRDSERGNEAGRLKALAQTAVEDGAMWAVKAATKRERE